MSEETAVQESSATETADVFNGENVSHAEFSKFRETGEVPERFKPADSGDSAPIQDSSEAEEAETSAASEAEKTQQEKPKPKQTAEERIAQLEANNKKNEAIIEKIRRSAGIQETQKVESSPTPKVEQPQATRPKPTAEDKNQDGTPKYSTYEDFVEELADWKAEQRWASSQREQQQQAQAKELSNKVADARARYGETFDEVLWPTVNLIANDKDINPNVKAMFEDSEVTADLVFTIGSDPKTLSDFLSMAKNNPGKALRYIATVENGIIEELTSKPAERDDKGQFATKEPPAKQKTSAPKPPTPVSGASTGAFDVSDESLSPEEWMRKRNADLSKR